MWQLVWVGNQYSLLQWHHQTHSIIIIMIHNQLPICHKCVCSVPPVQTLVGINIDIPFDDMVFWVSSPLAGLNFVGIHSEGTPKSNRTLYNSRTEWNEMTFPIIFEKSQPLYKGQKNCPELGRCLEVYCTLLPMRVPI